MTLSITPVDPSGIDNIAEGLTGFVDETQELQQSMLTTLFISGASEASNGRCAYLLLEDGSRMWCPNSLRCWIVDVSIKTQQYESYDPVEKLLVRVTAADGTTYVYRCGFDSWTATSFLTQLRHMTRKQLADQVTITLKSKGRATFVDVSYCEDGAFHRVQLPESTFTGEKLGYDDKLDYISYINGTAQDNQDSPVVEAQVVEEQVEEPFEVPPEEIDELLDEIRKPRRARAKSTRDRKVRFTADFPDGTSASTVSPYSLTHAVITPHNESWRVAEWTTDEASAVKWAASRDHLKTAIVQVWSKYSQPAASA